MEGERTDWRPPLLAAAAWAGSWAGTSAQPWFVAAGAAAGAVLVVVAGRRRSLLPAAIALVLVATSGLAVARAWASATGPVAAWAAEGAVVEVQARVAGGRVSDRGPGGPVWFAEATLDRVADAAIFGGLVLWFAGDGNNTLLAGLALACLILGSVVSYAKARAEGLGMTANVGIAERAERLVIMLVATGFTGLLDLPAVVLGTVLGLLAVASFVTVLQRMLEVRRQALRSQ